MKQQREFYNRLGSAWSQKKQVKLPFVKKTYCSACLTDHEEGKHLGEGVKTNAS